MTDKRDPRGIVNFFVRYLVLHMIFLVGLPLSYFADLALIYFFFLFLGAGSSSHIASTTSCNVSRSSTSTRSISFAPS